MNQDELNETEGFSEESLKMLKRSKQAFQVPADYFEQKSLLLEHALKEPFEVPADYFMEQTQTLNAAMEKEIAGQKQGRQMRLWVLLAAAAVFVGVLLIVIPGGYESPSFSDKLHQSNLEFEDLEHIDFDDDLFEEFVLMDTITPDTVSVKKLPVSADEFKPSKGQAVISWEDIDAADIEEYLNDEESIEIIDEF